MTTSQNVNVKIRYVNVSDLASTRTLIHTAMQSESGTVLSETKDPELGVSVISCLFPTLYHASWFMGKIAVLGDIWDVILYGNGPARVTASILEELRTSAPYEYEVPFRGLLRGAIEATGYNFPTAEQVEKALRSSNEVCRAAMMTEYGKDVGDIGEWDDAHYALEETIVQACMTLFRERTLRQR